MTAINNIKTLVIGDMHCKQANILPLVDAACEKYGIKRIVFLGDYTDDWDTTARDVVDALELQAAWAKRAEEKGLQTTFLIGNHDFEYIIGEGNAGTHHEAMIDIKEALSKINLLAATTIDGYLLTHGGLVQDWKDEYLIGCDDVEAMAERINEMYLGGAYYDWRKLASAGPSRGGYEIPSILWADRVDLKAAAAKGVKQIAGHTPVKTCTRLKRPKEEVWLCDTFSTRGNHLPIGDGSMLLVEDGKACKIKIG